MSFVPSVSASVATSVVESAAASVKFIQTNNHRINTSNWLVKKRTGEVVDFDPGRIQSAVSSCLKFVGRVDCDADAGAREVVVKVINTLHAQKIMGTTVEDVQALVIQQLWAMGWFDAGEHYTIYREERRRVREEREAQVDPEHLAAIEEDVKRFETPLQYYQFKSKFARWNEAKGRRETWEECVDRVMGWFGGPGGSSGWAELSEDEKVWLRRMMLEFKASPAMRVVQMAGPALDRCHMGTYNCTAAPIVDLFSFSELLYILMQGCGCGFSVESEHIDHLPRVKKQKRGAEIREYTVEDSTEGWCDALIYGLRTWFGGGDVEFHYHLIRKKGTLLKTKGGQASGFEPLRDTLDFCKRIVLSRQGRRLTDLDAHDMCCKIAEIGNVGGVRRASLISLSDLNSLLMRMAKHGNWYMANGHRSMSNNSAVYEEKPSAEEFMAEWLALVQSKSGERGIFNRDGINKRKPARRKKSTFICNPCQPGWATVATPNGIRKMDDIDVNSVIWSGEQWVRVARKICTGVKQVIEYRTTAGVFYGTENHNIFSGGEKIQVGLAESIDTCQVQTSSMIKICAQDVVDGLVMGDGMAKRFTLEDSKKYDRVLLCVGVKDSEAYAGSEVANYIGSPYGREDHRNVSTTISLEEVAKTYERTVPDRFRFGSISKLCGFLRGLYSANGSIVANRVTLKASSFKVIETVQEMLSFLGISSYYTTNKENVVSFKNGDYLIKQSYDLNIGTNDGRKKFSGLIGFIHPEKTERLQAIVSECTSKKGVKPKTTYGIIETRVVSQESVYSITVDHPTHKYWTGGLQAANCGEVTLRHWGCCNLSIAIVRPGDTLEEIEEKVRAATYFGTLQACCTNFNYVRKEWKKNCEEERLLGVDIMGGLDHPLLSPRNGVIDGTEEMRGLRAGLLDRLQGLVRSENESLAERFGINVSAASTVGKPGGNSGVFFNAATLSSWFADQQIRRTTESRTSPIARMLIDQGVPYEEVNAQNIVFNWLKNNPEGCIKREDMTALQQLENWLDWQTHWAEHAMSVTIYVKDEEWLEVGAWVFKHFDQITGLSFLPWDNGTYKHLPNERLEREEYERLVGEFPVINWARLGNYEDKTGRDVIGSRVLACTSGVCEI